MIKRNLILQCCLLLLFCSLFPGTDYVYQTSSPSNDFIFAVQRVDYGAIAIRNNSDFLEQKIDNGWPGTGTPDNPIVISNYRIELEQEGIVIENVDLSFIIQNCETNNYEYQYMNSVGFRINNCTNGAILESYAQMKEVGVQIEDSDNITVCATIITDCHTGVSLLNNTNIILAENSLGWNNIEGINVTLSERCQIFGNSIISVLDYGIVCVNDNFTIIENNDISSTDLDDDQFSHCGVYSVISWNLEIYEIYITDCWNGIQMLMTTDSSVRECHIADSTQYSIFLGSGTSNVTVLNNYFGPTSGTNAYDGGTGNRWDDPYLQDGNSWSDYSGAGYYFIAGPAGSMDRYPSVLHTDTSTTSSTSPPSITFPPPNGSHLPSNIVFRALIMVGIAIEVIVIFYLLQRRAQITYT